MTSIFYIKKRFRSKYNILHSKKCNFSTNIKLKKCTFPEPPCENKNSKISTFKLFHYVCNFFKVIAIQNWKFDLKDFNTFFNLKWNPQMICKNRKKTFRIVVCLRRYWCAITLTLGWRSKNCWYGARLEAFLAYRPILRHAHSIAVNSSINKINGSVEKTMCW